MIDLHSHILPGIDDGAKDLSVSMEMARMQVDQGVRVAACTPHILPGLYHNSGPQIRQAVAEFQRALDDEGIPLLVLAGADNHVVPDFVDGLKSGHLLSLGDTRYVLVEPPHNVVPARLDDLIFGILLAEYVPIITHPERLKWIDDHYDMILRLAKAGAWMQITSGSYRGKFGRRPKYWAERMTCEGIVHILASDAHDTVSRPPDLAAGRRAVEQLVGAAEATRMVSGRPGDILQNKTAAQCAPIVVEAINDAGENHEHDSKAARTHGAGIFLGGMRRLFSR